jgi:hypothetical protein
MSTNGDEARARRALEAARKAIDAAMAATAAPNVDPTSRGPHQQTDREAIEAWENEGDPN